MHMREFAKIINCTMTMPPPPAAGLSAGLPNTPTPPSIGVNRVGANMLPTSLAIEGHHTCRRRSFFYQQQAHQQQAHQQQAHYTIRRATTSYEFPSNLINWHKWEARPQPASKLPPATHTNMYECSHSDGSDCSQRSASWPRANWAQWFVLLTFINSANLSVCTMRAICT